MNWSAICNAFASAIGSEAVTLARDEGDHVRFGIVSHDETIGAFVCVGEPSEADARDAARRLLAAIHHLELRR